MCPRRLFYNMLEPHARLRACRPADQAVRAAGQVIQPALEKTVPGLFCSATPAGPRQAGRMTWHGTRLRVRAAVPGKWGGSRAACRRLSQTTGVLPSSWPRLGRIAAGHSQRSGGLDGAAIFVCRCRSGHSGNASGTCRNRQIVFMTSLPLDQEGPHNRVHPGRLQ